MWAAVELTLWKVTIVATMVPHRQPISMVAWTCNKYRNKTAYIDMKQHTYKIGIQFSDVLQRKEVFKSLITKLIWGRQQIYLLCNITAYGISNLSCLIYSFSKAKKKRQRSLLTRPSLWAPKKMGLHAQLRASWVPYSARGRAASPLNPPPSLHTMYEAYPMLPYSAVHTGPKR